MPSRGLLGAFEGAGKGLAQVGQIMMADDLENLRMEKMAKIKEGQMGKQQDFKAGESELSREAKASEGLLDRESRERIADKAAKAKGSTKWDPARGMSLQDRQKAAKSAIKEVMAGNEEYRTMPAEQVAEFKTNMYAEYGLDAIGENLIDRTAELDKPEPTDIGLLGSDEGQMAMAQSEKEERSKMGLKDYVPFVEPDEESIRKGALKMLGRTGDEKAPPSGDAQKAPVSTGDMEFRPVKLNTAGRKDGLYTLRDGRILKIEGGKAFLKNSK